MKKSFALITRSYKNGGYCIAGIDMETKRWIRLVSSEDPHESEIPKRFFEPYDDLEILGVEVVRAVLYGCQTENYLLDLSVPPERRGKFSFEELLTPAYVNSPPALFGNLYSHLSSEEIARQRTSLGLFVVRTLVFDYSLGDDGKPHYRSKFWYRGRQYAGISVTDPVYRRDEFAGGVIDRALLVVSLPAVPYPNGKYYKFIAKIFPLSAEEAASIERASAKVSTPRPRSFSRDFPDASEESVSAAVRFLRFLADGRDPDTNAVLDPILVLSPSYAAWFRYCAARMGQLPQRHREPFGKKAAEKRCTYLLRENIAKIERSDEPVTASRLAERVNNVREPYGKRLTAVEIGAFFVSTGMLKEEGTEHKRKFPTELGREYGIVTEQRITGAGVRYFIVLYGRAAQQFFLDHVERCIEVLDGSTQR